MALKILGIETSCDETAAGVVEDGRVLRSNIISSQAELHSRYGGVVPEVASRQHVRDLTPVLEQAVESCGLGLEDVDVVAVTYGPGLAGSLITGLNAAKAIAYTLGKPLIGVNHLEAHIYASWLTPANPAEDPGFPLACLVASGGHTDLLLMEGHGDYRLVGRTRDDAAGEAFDKAARILGLGFPGGPEIQRVSSGASGEFSLPRAWMRDTHDFSFSGLKTALLHQAQDRGVYLADSEETPEDEATVAVIRELASAFQESVVDVISAKLVDMARRYGVKGLVLGGGVIANARLREEILRRSPLPVIIPPPILCTDNGAMVAACAYYQHQRGEQWPMELDVEPGLPRGWERVRSGVAADGRCGHGPGRRGQVAGAADRQADYGHRRVTARFHDRGVSGFGGCNSYGARLEREEPFAREDGSFAEGLMAVESTAKDCVDPPGVTEQEQCFTELIPQFVRYRVYGSCLSSALAGCCVAFPRGVAAGTAGDMRWVDAWYKIAGVATNPDLAGLCAILPVEADMTIEATEEAQISPGPSRYPGEGRDAHGNGGSRLPVRRGQ